MVCPLLIDTTAPATRLHTHLSVTSGESSFAALSSRRFPTKHQGHMTSETIRTLTTRAIVSGFSFCSVGLGGGRLLAGRTCEFECAVCVCEKVT
jgi:hypothetical protein